ncbi:hypothetical protein CC1G_04303 [Coprinopsis cinerea okayama7|uniref:Sfi1 spindle body domain-containing protein n=1 Tax=Coprinopsis cinerea (strain Okayama-7 / 130 / ATCC MYA-4618 / FGSC 9003) TaxID=240176 RepID=A8NFM6_COPC7|nr:hypothetical protein CC1G_04303 [Coprinopsis cinerea okayama7\|eukprot:XP_001833324.2 hypothetical protein CC1G_04303 [Coprinopsis cinerea okayama7\
MSWEHRRVLVFGLVEAVPPRSSPPASRLNRILQDSADVSSSMESLAAELAELSADEIGLIDAAYSEVLAERGLADANETVCYGKLLKLGTLKGRTWVEKWEKVKPKRIAAPPRTRPAAPSMQQKSSPYGQACSVSDIFNPSDIDSTTDFAESTPRLQTRVSRVTNRPAAPPPERMTRQFGRALPTTRPYSGESSRTHRPSSPTKLNRPISPTKPYQPNIQTKPRTTVHTTSKFHPNPVPAQETPKSRVRTVNEAEAWRRIQMERDEQNADLFYQDKLTERFWTMWRQGHEWITTTSEQVANARERLIVEQSLQRWRDKFTLQRNRVQLADQFAKLLVFKRWYGRLEEVRHRKRRQEIRQEMRLNMKKIRDKWEHRVTLEAWNRWRQAHRLLLLSEKCNELVVQRFYAAWRSKWLRIGDSSARAEEFLYAQETRVVRTAWRQWRKATQFKILEATMRRRVELRIQDNALTRWRQSLRDCNTASDFYEHTLKRLVIAKWRNAVERVDAMERRADRQLAKSDIVFLFALMKIWKDKVNGNVLERRRILRTKHSVLEAWERKLHQRQADYALADRFSQRPGLAIVINCFAQWRHAYHELQSVLRMADTLYNDNTMAKVIMTWRKGLRNKLKMIKMARAAHKYFLTRQMYARWKEKVEERKRERLLQVYLLAIQKRRFQAWLTKTRVRTSREAAVQAFLLHRDKRTLNAALVRWVRRTVEIKEREFQITEQCKMITQISTFNKWKQYYKRRAEQRSLLENYHLVRREELLHRVFSRWMALTRLARSRRQVLHDAEEEVRLRTLEKYWEIWRERRLKDAEDEFLLRWNGNTVRTHFRRWYDKTKTPPAIQFHAVRVKRRYFDLWKEGMSRAVQVKEARNLHRARLLETYFVKWLEACKLKKTKKAIARARTLRLPTAVPRNLPPPVHSRVYPRRDRFLEAPSKGLGTVDSSPTHAPSVISSTYVGVPSASISVKSASPRPSFAPLSRDRSPFRSGEATPLSRTRSEDGIAPALVKKAPSSVTSLDAPMTRRVWPDLSRRPRLHIPK